MDSLKNRRVQFQKPGAKLELIRTDIPDVPSEGLLVKVEWAGMCHTDVTIWKSDWHMADDVTLHWGQIYPDFAWKWPIVMGHEICGRVEKFGAAVTPDPDGLQLGDRVVVYTIVGCQQCAYCKHNMTNRCPKVLDNVIGGSINYQGGFQDYVALPQVKLAVKLPDTISGDVGCLLACSGLTAWAAVKQIRHAVETAIQLNGKAKVLLMGAGNICLWTISFIQHLYSGKVQIFAADSQESKLQATEARGATRLLWPREAEQTEMVERTGSLTGGLDAAIDYIGSPDTVDRAFQNFNPNATLVVVGIAGGTAKLPLYGIFCKHIRIVGIVQGSLGEMKEVVDLVATSSKVVPPPISHVKPDQIEDVLIQMGEGTYPGKAVVDFTC